MSISTTINNRTITVEDSERQPCEIWCRVMGYYRPITIDAFATTEYNEGKVSEYMERKWYTVDMANEGVASKGEA